MGFVLQLQGRSSINRAFIDVRLARHIHPTGHIITRRRKDVRPVRAPLDLSDSVLVAWQLNFAHTTNGLARRRRRVRHATVPDPDRPIHARARDHKWTVFVPIYGEELRTRGWDGEDGGRDRVGKRVGCGTRCVGWRS